MHKEKLSSLIDGELLDNELISQLAKSKDMQKDWHSYHIIRDTLRGQINEATISLNIVDRIAVALDNEPTKLAPNIPLQAQPRPEHWQTLSFWQKIKHKVTPIVSQLGQIAIAACVTLVVIAGVQQYNQSATSNTDSPVFNTVPIGANVSPVAYGVSSNQPDNSIAEKEQLERIRVMLQDYELQRRLHSGQ